LGVDAPVVRGTFVVYGFGLLKSIGFWGLDKRVSYAENGGPILTVYTLYDVFAQGVAPFGGFR